MQKWFLSNQLRHGGAQSLHLLVSAYGDPQIIPDAGLVPPADQYAPLPQAVQQLLGGHIGMGDKEEIGGGVGDNKTQLLQVASV